jgi:hypothetical protein
MEYTIGFLIGIISTLMFFYIWGSKRMSKNKQIDEVMDIYSKLQTKSRVFTSHDNEAQVAAMEKAIRLLRGDLDETKN